MYQRYSKNDFYSRKAKEENYPARSVYKLKEIDEKYQLIKKGDRVLDLGCAPGSWLLYIAKKIGNKGRVVGIDFEDVKTAAPSNVVFLKKDVFDLNYSNLAKIGRYKVVVSDLSPNTSGISFVDSTKSLELCEKAFEMAKTVLEPCGNFLCKIFEGEDVEDFFREVKAKFKFVKRFRPKATRKESREVYIIAKDFLKDWPLTS